MVLVEELEVVDVVELDVAIELLVEVLVVGSLEPVQPASPAMVNAARVRIAGVGFFMVRVPF